MDICVRNTSLNIHDIYAVNFEEHFPVSPGCAGIYLLMLKPLSQIPPGLSEEGLLIPLFRFSSHVSVEQQ